MGLGGSVPTTSEIGIELLEQLCPNAAYANSNLREFDSVQGELAVFTDADPFEAAEGAEDGGREFVAVVFGMLHGSRAGEAAHRLDADHGAIAFEVNPIAPVLRLVAREEFLFAKGIDDFFDGAGIFGVGQLQDGFHVAGS